MLQFYQGGFSLKHPDICFHLLATKIGHMTSNPFNVLFSMIMYVKSQSYKVLCMVR